MAAIGVYGASMIYAAAADLRALEISNWASIAIAVAFLPAAVLAGLPGLEIAQHYGIGLIIMVAGAILFAMRMFGGADVKLIAAAGVWMDMDDLLKFFVLVALLGGVLALVFLVAGRFAPIRRRLPWLANGGPALKQPVPYGIAIAAAGIILIPWLSAAPATLKTVFTG